MYGFAIEILRANLENCKKIKDEALEMYRLSNDKMAMLGAMMAYETQVADISDAIETLESISEEMEKDVREGEEIDRRDGASCDDIYKEGEAEDG
jgi:hypothetical protein